MHWACVVFIVLIMYSRSWKYTHENPYSFSERHPSGIIRLHCYNSTSDGVLCFHYSHMRIAKDVCGCYAISDTCTHAGFSCWVMDFPFESLWQEHFCSELDLNLGVLVPPYRSIYVTCGQQARLCFIEFQGDGWSYAILSEVSISAPLSAVFVDVQLLRQCVCLFVFLCAYCFCLLCTRAPCGLFRMIDWLMYTTHGTMNLHLQHYVLALQCWDKNVFSEHFTAVQTLSLWISPSSEMFLYVASLSTLFLSLYTKS